MNISKYKTLIPAYFMLILIPCIFGFQHYFYILDVNAKHEINDLKFELYERATNFMIKTTPLEHFQLYFKKLADKLIPKIEELQPNQNLSSFTAEISKEINDLSKSLGENIRLSVFDKNANLLNPQDLKDYEIRFFPYLWKDIHGIKNIDIRIEMMTRMI